MTTRQIRTERNLSRRKWSEAERAGRITFGVPVEAMAWSGFADVAMWSGALKAMVWPALQRTGWKKGRHGREGGTDARRNRAE